MTSRRDKQAGDIMLVRLPAPNIMVISREREKRKVTSRRDKQAGDIMLVRLPVTKHNGHQQSERDKRDKSDVG